METGGKDLLDITSFFITKDILHTGRFPKDTSHICQLDFQK